MATTKRPTLKARTSNASTPPLPRAKTATQRKGQTTRGNSKGKAERAAKRPRPKAPTYWISWDAYVHVAMHAYGNDESQMEMARTAFAEYMEKHAKEVDAAVYLNAPPLAEESEAHLREKKWEPVYLGLDRWTRARAIALAAAKKLTLNELVNQAMLESLPL